MLNTFKYTLLELIRIPGIMVWAFLFPLILSTVFILMFSPLDDMAQLDPIPLVVVEDQESDQVAQASEARTMEAIASTQSASEAQAVETIASAQPSSEMQLEEVITSVQPSSEVQAVETITSTQQTDKLQWGATTTSSQAFKTFIEALGEGDDRLFDITYATSAEQAQSMVLDSQTADNSFIGYVQLEDGQPISHLAGITSLSVNQEINTSILMMVMDRYIANEALIKQLVEDNPLALTDSNVAASIFEPVTSTIQIEVTENQPKETVRFYFALLGMAALFGGNLGLEACLRLKPNVSPLGARRSIGATSHGRVVAATLAASWFVSFACLVVTYCFMRFVAGIDFGNRDIPCLVTIAVASCTATALGSAISAIPRVSENAKGGILTGIVCFASFFAGLYGQPTMELADKISQSFPVIDFVNPATQISQAFYSIMYYDSFGPLAIHLGILLAMALVFFILSARSLRRHRYASL